MHTRLEEALRKAIRFLDKHKIEYAVMGGVAVSQWGYDRLTQDIDLKVLVTKTEYAAMREMLRKAFPDKAREQLGANAFVVAVKIEGIIVDFALAYPGFDELVIQRAVKRKMNGWQAKICTAEDLIILKVIADRPKDWIDIEALLNARVHDLDHPYINEWLPQFAEALEKPEMLQNYQKLMAGAKRLMKH